MQQVLYYCMYVEDPKRGQIMMDGILMLLNEVTFNRSSHTILQCRALGQRNSTYFIDGSLRGWERLITSASDSEMKSSLVNFSSK